MVSGHARYSRVSTVTPGGRPVARRNCSGVVLVLDAWQDGSGHPAAQILWDA